MRYLKVSVFSPGLTLVFGDSFEELKARAHQTPYVWFHQVLCHQGTQRCKGKEEVHLVAEQGAFRNFREVMVMMKMSEAPSLLAVLKEMGRVKGGDECVMFLRKAEEPARPADAAAGGDMAGGGIWFEAERLLHQFNVRRKSEDAVDWSTDKHAVLKNRFSRGRHEDGMHDILCGLER